MPVHDHHEKISKIAQWISTELSEDCTVTNYGDHPAIRIKGSMVYFRCSGSTAKILLVPAKILEPALIGSELCLVGYSSLRTVSPSTLGNRIIEKIRALYEPAILRLVTEVESEKI